MSELLNQLATYYDTHEQEILDEFKKFLSFPSISASPKHQKDLLSCADYLANFLKSLGFTVEKWEKEKHHPVIFASFFVSEEKPTLLIYHHYDVQPVDPLEKWDFPPFEPTISNGKIYARGAQDNKGQCFYTLQAIKALIKETGSLPVNIKLCIEGEEEMGSLGLSKLIEEKKDLLKSDYLAVVDVGIPNMQTPAVTLGVRGIVSFDLELTGANTDAHSGSFGGILYNPLHALCEMLGKLHDERGKVTVPGFYDNVEELSKEEKEKISFDFDQKAFEKTFDTLANGGEKDFSPLERAWIRPTLEINGVSGGYAGPGFKTVIPSKAFAKISCRLVADQDPEKIKQLVLKHLQKLAPEGIKCCIHAHSGAGPAVRANPNSKIAKVFSKSFSEVFEKPCRYIFEGGSIPIASQLAKETQSEIILVGLGLTEDNIHAPNENFSLDRIKKGFLIIARALELLGK